MMTSYKGIKFFSHDIKLNLKNKSKLKRFILYLFKSEKKRLISISYIFSNDDFLLNLNHKFLHHNYKTDVLTFPIGENDGVGGEVYISVERIEENAVDYKTSLEKELHRVMFHGALHLCGYKDQTLSEKKQMREKEDYYLKAYESFT